MKAKMQLDVDERAKSLAMMQTPKSWPRWPWLPVKRRVSGDWPDLGLIHADETDPGALVKVYKGNLFSALYYFPSPKQEFHKEYASVHDLIADGWVVD